MHSLTGSAPASQQGSFSRGSASTGRSPRHRAAPLTVLDSSGAALAEPPAAPAAAPAEGGAEQAPRTLSQQCWHASERHMERHSAPPDLDEN